MTTIMRQLLIIALMLATAGCGGMPQRGTAEFREVRIVSEGVNGYAHKSVTADAILRGGHLSGAPGRAQLYEDRGVLPAEDLAALARLVNVLLHEPSADISDHKGQHIEIVLPDGSECHIAADASSSAQALWDLMYRQPVGAW